MDPSCPVFMAFSIDKASSPRTSPTMIRSGLDLSAALISCAIVIWFSPAILAFLISRRTRFSMPLSFSSAESSIVMIRSSFGIQFDIPFSNVVFPLPVPPEIKMLYLALTRISRNCSVKCVKAPFFRIHSIVIGSPANFLIVIAAPFKETGGSITLTLEPSGSLASTMGFVSLTIRLAPATICWIT